MLSDEYGIELNDDINEGNNDVNDRTGQTCFGQKSRLPGSIGKTPTPFGASAILLKFIKGRLKFNPVPPHVFRTIRSKLAPRC